MILSNLELAEIARETSMALAITRHVSVSLRLANAAIRGLDV